METRANYALIGAFVLMAAAAVIGFALWLGSRTLIAVDIFAVR